MIRHLFLALALLCGLAGMARPQSGLDLRNADLEGFVRIVAEQTGRGYVLDPRVDGTVTVVAPETVSPDALFEIFLQVLELNGLTIVEGRDVDRIVPIGTAPELAAETPPTPTGGGFETRVIGLTYADPVEVADIVRPLLPPEAVLSTDIEQRLLIISDRRQNFRRIEELIANLDRPRGVGIDTVQVRNGNAAELTETIRGLEIAPPGATLSADARSNAIVVSGPQDFRLRVREIVARLDTPQRTTATRVVQLSYADATQLEEVIRRGFGGGTEAEDGTVIASEISVVADPGSNALIVSGPSDRIGDIVQSIHALDHRPSQVLIEAVVFELSVKTFADLSVQFGAVLNNAVAGGAQFALDGRTTLSGALSSALSDQAPNFGNGGLFGGAREGTDAAFAGFLTALSQSSSARVLAIPSILTLNNQEAEIVVAQNVPFVTGSFATVGESAIPDQPFQTIERQDVGLTLRVTPQITIDDTVRLAILQEVSNLTNTQSQAGGEITARRSINTNVLVRDGCVIMLGGLLENGNGSVGQEVPGASRLPVIGNLFRGRNATTDQRVLLVLLRPRLVSTDSEATRLTQEVAQDARRASRYIDPMDDGRFPGVPDGALPYDGADLNQPFDASFIDPVARERMYPPLPSRLRFGGGDIAP